MIARLVSYLRAVAAACLHVGHRSASPVQSSHFAGRDLLSESLAGILQRPARSALTALGTVLGVGAFVTVLGLTATTSSQIDDRFNALTATEVSVEDVAKDQNPDAGPGFPEDAEPRISRLNGVEHAGIFWTVANKGGGGVSSSPIEDGSPDITVVAASPEVILGARGSVSQGRSYGEFHESTQQQVAVIGSAVATQLGISSLWSQPAIFINGEPFTVIGILSDVERKPELLLSVMVPRSTAENLWGPPVDETVTMLVTTRLGAAQQIAREAPTALRPDHPEYLRAIPPENPKLLRSNVTSDLNQLFLLLAAVCLVIGAVGIANTTLVAVLERTGEIGLRRALGAQGRHITSQFLAESGALGALGGLAGTSLGTIAVVGVAFARDWTPVLHPATVLAAPLIGMVTGLTAGLYPAWRAVRIQPADALRR